MMRAEEASPGPTVGRALGPRVIKIRTAGFMRASVVVGLSIFVVLAIVGGVLSVSFIPFLDASEAASWR